jgi:hypothetical protein
MANDWRAWTARVAVLLLSVVAALVLLRLWGYANEDDPEVVERSDIRRAAGAACAVMRDATAAVAVSATHSARQRAGAINAQNDAVVSLVSAVRALGPRVVEADQPTGQWLEDWERLVTTRDAYARSVAAGKPRPLALPVIDGRPLVERLNDVGVNCRVPLVLLQP